MNDKSKDGGPAFPVCFEHEEATSESPGMSLRDYFAAAALQGVLANTDTINLYDLNAESKEAAAESCYAMADAMLKARER